MNKDNKNTSKKAAPKKKAARKAAAKKKSESELFEEKRNDFLDKCEIKRKQIEKDLSKDSDEVKVHFETFTEYDKDFKTTGNFFVAFIREPHFLNAVDAMDLIWAQKLHKAGLLLFDVCVLREHSSPQVYENRYKMGLLPKISLLLDAIAPDLKKN